MKALSASCWAAGGSQPILDLTVGDALRDAAAAAAIWASNIPVWVIPGLAAGPAGATSAGPDPVHLRHDRNPQGAVLHHRGIVSNARLFTARLGLRPGSPGLSPMPAVVPPALAVRAEAEFGAPVSISFARTGASPVITQAPPQDTAGHRAVTLGRPLPQTEVKITAAPRGPAARGTHRPRVPDRSRVRDISFMIQYRYLYLFILELRLTYLFMLLR